MDVKVAQNMHNSSFLSKYSGAAGNKSICASAFFPKLAGTATLGFSVIFEIFWEWSAMYFTIFPRFVSFLDWRWCLTLNSKNANSGTLHSKQNSSFHIGLLLSWLLGCVFPAFFLPQTNLSFWKLGLERTRWNQFHEIFCGIDFTENFEVQSLFRFIPSLYSTHFHQPHDL